MISKNLHGVEWIEADEHSDERGTFRSMAAPQSELPSGELCFSENPRVGTLRGLHCQRPPHGQRKAVFCVQGSVFDVVVDLRKGSPTEGCWSGRTLTSGFGGCLLIPEGVAHGFLTLEPDSVVGYLTEGVFRAEAGLIVRWNDPRFEIDWPSEPRLISNKDQNAPDWDQFL